MKLNSNHTTVTETTVNSESTQLTQKITGYVCQSIAPIDTNIARGDHKAICGYLSSEDISDTEKIQYIHSIHFDSLESLLPVLRSYFIQKYHAECIDRAIETISPKEISRLLTQGHTFGPKHLLEDSEIPLDTWMYLIGRIGTKSHSLKELLPHLKHKSTPLLQAYFLRAFLREQSWEEVREILNTIPHDQSFIGTESLMKVPGFLLFDEILPFLKNKKIPLIIKEYLAWKCQPLSNNDVLFELLQSYPHKELGWGCIFQLIGKGCRNISLNDLEFLIGNENPAQFIAGFSLLAPHIREDAKEAFLDTHNISLSLRAKIFPYRTKTLTMLQNHMNSGADQEITGPLSIRYALQMRTGRIDINTPPIHQYISAYPSLGSQVQSQAVQLMKRFPDENIYNLYRQKADEFLEGRAIYDTGERQMNNQSLLTYQKQYLSSSALQNAKQIGIDISLFELALYIRYAHRVDYPEIAELIGIFLDAYISGGYSRYFSSFRIVPRNAESETKIQPFIDTMKSGKYYNLIGSDATHALHTCATCMYLSHSGNGGKYGIPSITSQSMRTKHGDIVSNIELESRRMTPKERTLLESMEFYDIFQETLRVLTELEKGLDRVRHVSHR